MFARDSRGRQLLREDSDFHMHSLTPLCSTCSVCVLFPDGARDNDQRARGICTAHVFRICFMLISCLGLSHGMSLGQVPSEEVLGEHGHPDVKLCPPGRQGPFDCQGMTESQCLLQQFSGFQCPRRRRVQGCHPTREFWLTRICGIPFERTRWNPNWAW